MKKERKLIFITSLMAFLPTIIGLILYKKLPDKMPSHWDFEGNIDGYTDKLGFIIFLGTFLLIMHLLCVFITSLDKKNENQSRKILKLVLWIIPAVSVMLSALIYPTALGAKINASRLLFSFLGFIFVVIGNYLPKVTQNKYIGIKIPTTLKSEENWNKTHRMAGPLWIAGGFMLILLAFIKTNEITNIIIFVSVITLCTIIPVVYSIII
nr:SdpI family protein [Lachnospiraceae bacterium]